MKEEQFKLYLIKSDQQRHTVNYSIRNIALQQERNYNINTIFKISILPTTVLF